MHRGISGGGSSWCSSTPSNSLGGRMKIRRIAVILSCCALVVAGCGSQQAGTPTPATSTSTSTPSPSSESTSSAATTTTTTKSSATTSSSTTSSKSTTSSPTSSAYEPILGEHFEGTGDDVVTITKPADKAALLTFSCPDCQSNVVVKTDNDLLVNEIGSYSGTHLIDIRNGENTTTAEVTADGSWTMDIADITTAPEATSGTGDSVIWVNTGTKVAITHDGDSNFAVHAASSSGLDLLVNEIGAYSGTKAIDTPAIVDITADGNWTITPS